MKQCYFNSKKFRICYLALVISVLLLSGTIVFADETRPGPDFTMISQGGFGDPQNNYAWSVSGFKDDLYVGTGRNVPYFVSLALKKQGVFAENMTITALTHPNGAPPPQFTPANQSPPSMADVITWSNDMRPEIWRFHAGTWTRVHQASTFVNPANGYTYPEGIGYRAMTVFTDSNGVESIYAGVGFGFGRVLIVRSTDGVTWVPVNTNSIPSRDTRAMISHNGKLYVGTADGVFASGSPSQVTDTWEKVADFQVASLKSFNGYLYAGTGNPNGASQTNGFEVWRSTTPSPSGPGDWVRVVSGGAGDSWNVLAATMQEYKGDLYIGSMNLPFGTGTGGLKGFDLVRLNSGDTWDLIVGNYHPKMPTDPRGPPLSGWPSGYANPFNLYAWSISEYDGNLYLGTFDIFSFARFIGDTPGGYEMLLSGITPLESAEVNDAPVETREFITELSGLDRMNAASGNGTNIIPAIELMGREFGGADLWTTQDGVHWVPLELNGFGDPDNYGLRTMCPTPEGFIVGTANPFKGCQIWLGTPADKPPASVTNLVSVTPLPDSITWTWIDPSSPGLDKVMVYLDSKFETDVPKGKETYTALSLLPGTEHTISTRTIGTNGRINQTWVNNTARTSASVPLHANFTVSPAYGPAPLEASFNDTSGGVPNVWNLSYGDGMWFNTTIASERNVSHTYATPGTYTARLTISNAGGSNTTVPGVVIVVTPPPTTIPTTTPVTPVPTTQPIPTGNAYISSVPYGAEIFVDGGTISWGITPTIITLIQGTHQAVLSKEGYKDAILTFDITADGTTMLPPQNLVRGTGTTTPTIIPVTNPPPVTPSPVMTDPTTIPTTVGTVIPTTTVTQPTTAPTTTQTTTGGFIFPTWNFRFPQLPAWNDVLPIHSAWRPF